MNFSEAKNIAVVAFGGILGSLSRWAISLIIPNQNFAWGTLAVNFIGSVVLTALVVYVKHHPDPRWWWRPGIGSGFCGAFTTYSAFALKLNQYLDARNIHALLEYSLISLIGTFILVYVTYEFSETRWAKK